MIGNYPVITLCGSTRFKDQFLEAQKRLTLAGNIVINVGGYIGQNFPHRIPRSLCYFHAIRVPDVQEPH